MRLTVVYPAAQEATAADLRIALSRISSLDLSWIATNSTAFLEDLTEAAAEEGPLLVVISQNLIDSKVSPRLAFKPLLEKIERGQASQIGLINLDSIPLPKLLEKLKAANRDHVARIATNWTLGWLGQIIPIRQPLCNALAPLVDQSTIVQIEGLDTADCIEQLRPYFESIELLEVHQQSLPLLEAQLDRIRPQGRILYVVEGHPSPLPPVPANASLLHIPHAVPDPIANAVSHAAKLIPQIPNIEGEPLPFSTYHFEHLLPILFEQNWPLAERLARRAGTFFRINHRVAEAIWLYELFNQAATAQGQSSCAEFAAHELDWLRAGGEAKQKLLNATQASLFF